MFSTAARTFALVSRRPTACYSSSANVVAGVENPIVLTDDDSTIVCWHPPTPYPYEFTRPMPLPKTDKPSTVLKTDDFSAVTRKKKDLQNVFELAELTRTTKHRWFPQRSSIKKKKIVEKEREFL
ncbi:unnamed protein product [Nesidiocoris tenuis]|uniref:Large ribosomal subunit protein mL42 n=1 Tax=Nesidiocoris tenuis TaxID=355587 RepID=A0A6H5FZ98_9HEMI|nr:unnamed protein product [Nesidiocoris tenuis]